MSRFSTGRSVQNAGECVYDVSDVTTSAIVTRGGCVETASQIGPDSIRFLIEIAMILGPRPA